MGGKLPCARGTMPKRVTKCCKILTFGRPGLGPRFLFSCFSFSSSSWFSLSISVIRVLQRRCNSFKAIDLFSRWNVNQATLKSDGKYSAHGLEMKGIL